MAKTAGAKKVESSRKGQKAKKVGKKLSALYNISSGKIERKNKFCPKCGQGYFLGAHSNRLVCGQCKYVEYIKR